jgi:hypothetical protein
MDYRRHKSAKQKQNSTNIKKDIEKETQKEEEEARTKFLERAKILQKKINVGVRVNLCVS